MSWRWGTYAPACVEHRCEVTIPSIHCGYLHITIFSPKRLFPVILGVVYASAEQCYVRSDSTTHATYHRPKALLTRSEQVSAFHQPWVSPCYQLTQHERICMLALFWVLLLRERLMHLMPDSEYR